MTGVQLRAARTLVGKRFIGLICEGMDERQVRIAASASGGMKSVSTEGVSDGSLLMKQFYCLATDLINNN